MPGGAKASGPDASGLRTALAILGLASAPASALGFARFAYALLLPPMRSQLQWSFTVAGIMNGVNAAGYLLGAILAARLAARWGLRRAFLASLAATAAALAATGASGNIWLLLATRSVSGATGAVAFVLGGGLVAAMGKGASHSKASLSLGAYFGGGGIGIVVSGVFIPWMLRALGPGSWKLCWVAMGVATFAFLIPAAAASSLAHPKNGTAAAPNTSQAWDIRSMAPTVVAYGLFGAGYIAYMTFIVAYLDQRGAPASDVTLFWVLLGIAATVSGLAWGPVVARMKTGHGVALVTAAVAIGALMPLVSASRLVEFGSAVVFGLSFLAVVTAVMAAARRMLEPSQWTAALGGMTVAFGIGQSLGPVLAGALSEGSGGVRLGLEVSVAVLGAGALAALGQREPTYARCRIDR